MDSGSPPFPKFELQPDRWNISRIVLLPDRSGAEAFRQQIFPEFCHCIIASAGREFPEDPELNQLVFRALENDSRLRVAVFGLSCLKQIRVKSERILVLDDLIMQDFRKHPEERKLGLNLNPQNLAFLLRSFFSQWDKLDRIGNTSFAYTNFAEYDNQRFDWKARLVGAKFDELERLG